jgi:hypothetical protein
MTYFDRLKAWMYDGSSFKDDWSKIPNETLFKVILKEHQTNPTNTSTCLKVLIIRLFNTSESNVKNLLFSPDKDTQTLGIQLLFQTHIDLYNVSRNSPFDYSWELDTYPIFVLNFSQDLIDTYMFKTNV